jgi:swainsonine biosynthesis dioxygenase SwnH1/2
MGSIAPSTPELTRLPSTAPYSEIEDVLLRDGGLIITSLLDKSHISRMLSTLNLHYPPQHDFAYTTPGTFFPHETKTLWSLAGRSKSCGHDVCMHPLLTRLRQELLHMNITRGNDSGTSDMQTPTTSIPPRLSLSVAFDMRPGARQQPLHRDEDVWGTTHEHGFTRESIRQIGVLIAGTKSVRENGATLVIPGSHLWDDKRIPREEEAVYAEMEPGDALIFLSATRHAGGANKVQNPEDPLARRVMFSYFFAKGYLRQEENMLVSIPREVVLGMSEDMQRLIGYEASGSHCGFVEFKSPVEMGLRGLFERSAKDFLDPHGWQERAVGDGTRADDEKREGHANGVAAGREVAMMGQKMSTVSRG